MMPTAILLCGVGGTGKSTAANHILTLLLAQRGVRCSLIRFDELRKSLAPLGSDSFSRDPAVKAAIYCNAGKCFMGRIQRGEFLVIDCGLSVEAIRRNLKQCIPGLRVVHIFCPLWLAVLRDTIRSLKPTAHERGRFLHLRALRDILNPFKRDKFPQPGLTYPFEYPECADLHVNTFRKPARKVAEEIVRSLGIPMSIGSLRSPHCAVTRSGVPISSAPKH